MRLAGLDRRAQRRALAEQVPLAGELLRASAGASARRAARPRAGAAAGGLLRPSNSRPIRYSIPLVTHGPRRRLQDETADVLSRLIRFDTVNPPGNERECQEWLAATWRARVWTASCPRR